MTFEYEGPVAVFEASHDGGASLYFGPVVKRGNWVGVDGKDLVETVFLPLAMNPGERSFDAECHEACFRIRIEVERLPWPVTIDP